MVVCGYQLLSDKSLKEGLIEGEPCDPFHLRYDINTNDEPSARIHLR